MEGPIQESCYWQLASRHFDGYDDHLTWAEELDELFHICLHNVVLMLLARPCTVKFSQLILSVFFGSQTGQFRVFVLVNKAHCFGQ